MKNRYYKRAFALALAGVLAVSGMGVPAATAEAGEIVAFGERTARDEIAIGASMENGINYDKDYLKTEFNGTNVFEATDADVTLFKGNIGKANSMDISITFKPTSVNRFMNLLEICNSSKNTSSSSPAEEVGIIIGSDGTVYFMTGAYAGSTDWSIKTGTTITAGTEYTLVMSVSGNGFSVQLNDGVAQTVSADSNDKNTKKFVRAFFGEDVSGYTDWRQDIDSVVIGGLKSGSAQTHVNFTNFNGEITSVTIAGEVSDDIPTGSGVASTMFSTSLDNTWLFGGGVEAQGRFEEIGGVRNYVGQFEEFVRWKLVSTGTDYKSLQRYTINVGKEGQDAETFAADLDGYIARVSPKAVSYLIGPEDYNGDEGIDAFKTALSTIIDKSLAMKDNSGCAVIQYPHAVQDAAVNDKIEDYISAAQEVLREKSATERARIAVVDHFAQTNTDDFKESKLTDNGLLNAEGHYEIAKQFAQVVYGSIGNFPVISLNRNTKETPDTYVDIMPEATATANGVEVAIDGAQETEWKYILVIDGTEITGTASGNPFTIEKLPEGKDYTLTVQTKDGSTQFSTVSGTITEGNVAEAPVLTELQQAIRDKVDNTEDSLTWLFMGDSITHGAMWLNGYDGIAQLFEKYVKEDLGRIDDIVINTACSSATAITTLSNIEQRMTKYKPDIVSIMLGTNDTINSTSYNDNLKAIVNKIREVNPDTIIIFRTPTPSLKAGYASKLPGENGSVASMKKVADECGDILVIDQYTDWNNELTTYPYLYTANYYYGDGNLHPGEVGHLRMTKQFITECGLNTNTKIANLSYDLSYAEETSAVKPNVQIAESNDGITVSKSDLQTAYSTSETIGEMTVVLTDSDGRTYTKSTGLDGDAVTMSLPTSRNYEVKVVADIEGNTAKHVTFTGDTILLTTGSEKEDLQDEITQQEELYSGSMNDYTEDSVTAFREAYEAAKEAIANGVTDAEQLSRLTEALAKSAEALKEKTVVTGTQTVTITGSTVNIPEGTPYTVSDVTWNEAKTSGSFTMTADADVRFGSDIQVIISSAEGLQIKAVDAEIGYDKITVTFTVAENASDNGNGENKGPDNQQNGGQDNNSPNNNNPIDNKPNDNNQTIVAGKTYDAGNYYYKVTSTTDMTAEVVGLKNTGIKKITINNLVSLGGKNFTVTSIAANAFKGNKKITSVVIKKNVKTIGKNAFANCTKLKKVTINSTKLTTINAKAFYGCKNLKSITIKSKVLKKVGKNAFKGISAKAVIKVPKAKRTAYTNKVLKNKGQAKTVKIK